MRGVQVPGLRTVEGTTVGTKQACDHIACQMAKVAHQLVNVPDEGRCFSFAVGAVIQPGVDGVAKVYACNTC